MSDAGAHPVNVADGKDEVEGVRYDCNVHGTATTVLNGAVRLPAPNNASGTS